MKRALEMLLYESKATVVLALRVERPAKCWQVKWHRAVSVFICEDAFFLFQEVSMRKRRRRLVQIYIKNELLFERKERGKENEENIKNSSSSSNGIRM